MSAIFVWNKIAIFEFFDELQEFVTRVDSNRFVFLGDFMFSYLFQEILSA